MCNNKTYVYRLAIMKNLCYNRNINKCLTTLCYRRIRAKLIFQGAKKINDETKKILKRLVQEYLDNGNGQPSSTLRDLVQEYYNHVKQFIDRDSTYTSVCLIDNIIRAVVENIYNIDDVPFSSIFDFDPSYECTTIIEQYVQKELCTRGWDNWAYWATQNALY